MAEFKIDGRMKVKSLKEKFFNEYGGVLRVYSGRSKAKDDASLASIRANDVAKGGELTCQGNRTVGKFEKEMWDVFGIKVQVATKDDFILALDGITLAKLKEIPERATKEEMEELVAYKRKEKEVKPEEAVPTDNGESLPLIQKLRETFIVETEDQVYYDAEGCCDDDIRDLFINNLKAQMYGNDVKVLESLEYKDAESFIEYLNEDPDGISLARSIVIAAYCTFYGIEIDDDTRETAEEQLYYFNDCGDLHYEYETDIDLG